MTYLTVDYWLYKKYALSGTVMLVSGGEAGGDDL